MTTNSTGFSARSPKEDSATINILLMILTIILMFVSVGGNALTIAAVSRFKNLRYPSNIMIAALAISDFFVASLFTTINLLRTHMPFLFTVRPSCLVVLFITQTVSLTSVVFQAVLSLERFYAIQFPYHYHAHATTAIHAIWSASIAAAIVVLSLPVLSGIDQWSEEVVCYFPLLFPSSYTRIIAAIVIIFQILGLLAFLRVLFAEIKFRCRDRNLQTSEMEKPASLQSTLMVLAYGVSLCFYMPHIVYYFLGTLSNYSHNPLILEVLRVLDVCNTAVNYFIYGFKNRKFREAYKCLLGFKRAHVQPLTTD
ncbi:trace amine-associated receptor 2-like [Gigantopelta aegis]|uniref:trace amine-associated receptor 2-like n=1 Tax=Gigantopelta aegis TaxID=1735272 RepID=UPI001B88D417|nr:trace amine-associated receptor 2-like [Gigantopelta aegis]